MGDAYQDACAVLHEVARAVLDLDVDLIVAATKEVVWAAEIPQVGEEGRALWETMNQLFLLADAAKRFKSAARQVSSMVGL